MPRTIRIQFPGADYHIYSRGNEKKDIFRDDLDRYKFISIVSDAKKKFPFDLHAYALMPNHYHMLLTIRDKNLPKIMHSINQRYSSFFNWKYKRVGRFFQGPYNSILVEDNAYFMDLTRYIHNNPIDIIGDKSPESYPWSSLKAYVLGKGNDIVTLDKITRLFGAEGREFGRRYRMFMAEGGAMDDTLLKEGMFESHASAGCETLRRIQDEYIARKKTLPKSLQRQLSAPPEAVFCAVERVFKADRAEIMRKKGRSNYARKAAMYLVNKYCPGTLEEKSGLFQNTHKSNIQRTIKSAEKEIKSNTSFAPMLARVELELSQQLGPGPICCDNVRLEKEA